jgi:hypothetical protein
MSRTPYLFTALTVAPVSTIAFTVPPNSDTLISTSGDRNRKWGSEKHEIIDEPSPSAQLSRSPTLVSSGSPFYTAI